MYSRSSCKHEIVHIHREIQDVPTNIFEATGGPNHLQWFNASASKIRIP
jgi:hypothetical protein